MRTFFAILTAALVGIHALLGCCWHHHHACAAGHDEHVMLGLVDCDDAEHGEDSHEHENPHRDVCQESPCVFTTIHGPTPDVAPQMILWQPICLYDTAQLGARTQSSSAWATDHPPAATIPMRLHLFQGLLLI